MNDNGYIGIIAEIFDGFTETKLRNETVFIKHFSISDQRDIERLEQKHFERAVKKGVPKELSVLSLLEQEGLWTQKNETDIKIKLDEIDNLKITQSKLPLQSQRDSIGQRIDSLEKEVFDLTSSKKELVGVTAESYAEGRANEDFLHKFIFKDRGLTELFFSSKDFDDLEYADLIDIQAIRIDIHKRLSDINIQTAILKPFFSLYMSLCEDAMSFYGKPVVELSISQLKLLAFGRMFQNIFSYTENIPDNIREDPKKLISFAEAQRSKEGGGKKMLKDDADASMVFGATQDDIKNISANEGGKAVLLGDVLKEKGGKLNMDDMMKLSGHD